uniref:Dol-P-Glc:Glc(2)Man(9)GlcNAc(2)-PP-Dol alpha-1,2-glucosyltransferase n=1 Tax=Noccaea caerulescens TaxID=107243 RepID=A0A1J3D106_NOCCA
MLVIGGNKMGKLAVAAITSLWVIPMSIIVNNIVPEPYMDEIFHVPQAQQYCYGNLRSWNPMITTPPGLYYLSLAHVASLFPGMLLMNNTTQSFSEACSTSVLRSTNAVLAVLCGVLVYEIIRFLGPNLSDRKATLMALVMSLYPLHWFFTFLYYTDVASLTAFLAMYLACLRRRYMLSALFGSLAIFIRQTNVVWMLFVACSGVIDFTLDSPRQKEKQKVNQDLHQSVDGKGATLRSNLRKRKSDSSSDTRNRFNLGEMVSSTEDTSGLVYDVYALISTSWNMKWSLLFKFSPFVFAGAAFGVFILWNGGIVLGAKEAHVLSPHFAQIMYFSLVSTLFTAPLHFSVDHMRSLFQKLLRNGPLSLLLTLVALIAGFASVHFFSLAHPYLLADNRHYPFYLWRKVINAHWLIKYMLVPVYVYSWFSILTLLAKTRRKIWVLVYFLATFGVLVPTPLIEFRYYTVPFYLFMLHSSVRSRGCATWLLIGTIFVCINVFTMAMFLFRPFKWSHEDGVQRFIW